MKKFAALAAAGLIALFRKTQGEELSDDSLLLA